MRLFNRDFSTKGQLRDYAKYLWWVVIAMLIMPVIAYAVVKWIVHY